MPVGDQRFRAGFGVAEFRLELQLDGLGCFGFVFAFAAHFEDPELCFGVRTAGLGHADFEFEFDVFQDKLHLFARGGLRERAEFFAKFVDDGPQFNSVFHGGIIHQGEGKWK